jgi:hypothetical protein
MTWQPIETAPKDGTPIHAKRVLDNGHVFWRGKTVWRQVKFPACVDAYGNLIPYGEAYETEGWMSAIEDKRVPEPTHWQPGDA